MQATALDPGFALAYARASLLNNRISRTMTGDHRARKAKARAQAEEALRLSPTLGEAHMALGLCLYWGEKNYDAALKEFEVAAATSPNNAEIYTYVGGIYRRQGRWRESVASFERALSLDPRNDDVAFLAGNNHLFLRDWPARYRPVTIARWKLRRISWMPRSALLTSKWFETAIPLPAAKFCKPFRPALIPMEA